MKRLIKKAFGQKLYHGTDLISLKQITQSGLIQPQETQGDGMGGLWEDHFTEEEAAKEYEGYTFLATDFYKAATYAESKLGWFNVNNNSNGNEAGNYQVVIEVDLPEEALMADTNDSPKAKTWQQSADKIGQVKILGPITSGYIRKVSIKAKGWNNWLEFNFTTWEQDFNEYLQKESETNN